MDTHYAALDVESTGTSPYSGDKLLQVAAFVTDMSYEVSDRAGIDLVFKFSEEEAAEMRDSCLPIVRKMHDKTGLWDRIVSDEAVSYSDGDRALASYFSGFGSDALYLLGNSITLDRNFLEVYMPLTFGTLHYRSLDVTSVRMFMEEKFGAENIPYRSSDGSVSHEARSDILQSLEQIKFYKSLLD